MLVLKIINYFEFIERPIQNNNGSSSANRDMIPTFKLHLTNGNFSGGVLIFPCKVFLDWAAC